MKIFDLFVIVFYVIVLFFDQEVIELCDQCDVGCVWYNMLFMIIIQVFEFQKYVVCECVDEVWLLSNILMGIVFDLLGVFYMVVSYLYCVDMLE